MIVNNAASRCDVDFWTKHLLNTEENERADLKQIRGLRADTLREALEEMQQQARINPRVKNFMYHADFNPRLNEHLTEEQRDRAFEIFENERGIPANAARVVMEHVKHGRKHWHVIWYRLDEQGRPFSDKHDAIIAHTAGEKIAAEFGLEKVISPLTRDEGTPRPERAPKPWEMLRGMNSEIDVRDVTAEVTELRQQCASGIEFQAALDRHGYILARGDKIIAGEPALMIIDPAGDDHHLPRRIKGMNSREVNEFMRDVDREALPTIRQAQEQQQQRKIDALEADRATVRDEIAWQEALAKAAIEKEKVERQFIAPTEPAREETRGGRQDKEQPEPYVYHAETRILEAEKAAMLDPRAKVGDPLPNAAAFADELEKRGIAFALANADESYRSHREAEFAKGINRRAPEFTQGEIVMVTEPRLERLRAGEWTDPARVHKLDQDRAETYLAYLSVDKSKLQGVDATKAMLDGRAEERAAYWRDIRLERATDIHDRAPTLPPKLPPVGKTATRAAAGALDLGMQLTGLFFSALDTPKSPRQQERDNREGERITDKTNAEAEYKIDLARYTGEQAQQRRNEQEIGRASCRERV